MGLRRGSLDPPRQRLTQARLDCVAIAATAGLQLSALENHLMTPSSPSLPLEHESGPLDLGIVAWERSDSAIYYH
jgi:hypothetical protein